MFQKEISVMLWQRKLGMNSRRVELWGEGFHFMI